ncbi:N-acetylmuramoyl-L-alanine amidase [Stenotrophomonas rhizophila]|uniref:N-acetylmuramoyl-L-alanine amidase n=1 Tax=Stenotrophomonas rhizophila TaxID=216778 RepID=UPI001E53C7AD|nr:N-acetylmuramoyl-L-alanine amidase [Stenotrophomonas rhizophila]MCC7632958.1 N-acetylmuramoyl-L-alanine amidase [Stenotrophomonas rhizophila]MCC7662317.1 N-acetylmuramoyl-L-alanine amidase [Stenotrophomonas rhizophila]
MQLGKPLTAICAAVGLCLASALAWAGEVRQVALETGATGTRAEIALSGSGGYKTLSLAGPNRLVVDFPDSSAVRNLKLPAPKGVVTAVRTGQPVPGTFRVVFDLAESVAPFKPQMLKQGNDSRLVIEWPGDAPTSVASTAAAPAAPAATPAATTAAPAATPRPSAPTPAEAAQARSDAARATALLTASVRQQASATAAAPVPAPATPAATTTANVAAAGNAASPAAILAGQATAVVVPAPTPVPVATAEPPRPVMPSEASRIKMRAGMRQLVVAIDPGHGGQDPGAVGPTGKREKDITLAVARELARQVNATPGLKAYLTRDTDVFIPLPMRAQKARAAKADIFISIHADAAENRAATGSSVYVLSTKGASSQRARWLADKENAADLVGGVRLQQTEGTLANVLLDLAQSGYMKASEDAAGHVLGGLKRIGKNHKPNIERANFAVLRTSDMPAMLVETAFISNPDEERRLIDPAYQRQIAGAVLDGVHTFFSRQPPPGTLYAARAQVEIDAASTVAGGSK